MSSSPVKYETTFKSTDLLERKIEHNGNKVKCITFSGCEGFEAFFAVLRHFITIAKQELALYATDAAGNITADLSYVLMFNKFKNVLRDQALAFWENEIITNNFPLPVNQTEHTWEVAIMMMKRSFAGGKKARDHILEYLDTKDCRKNVKISVNDHIRRIDQLLDYADESEGSEAITTRYKRNKIIVNTFPKPWQHNLATAAIDLEATTSYELIDFFSEQKDHFDDAFKRKKENEKHQKYVKKNIHPIFHPVNERPAKRPQRLDQYNPNAPCPIHNYLTHNHLWKNCHTNRNGQYYRPEHRGRDYFNSRDASRFRHPSNSSNQQNRRPPQQSNYDNRNQQRRQGGEHHYNEDINENSLEVNQDDNNNADMHAFDIAGGHTPLEEQSDSRSTVANRTDVNWFFQRPDQPHQRDNRHGA